MPEFLKQNALFFATLLFLTGLIGGASQLRQMQSSVSAQTSSAGVSSTVNVWEVSPATTPGVSTVVSDGTAPSVTRPSVRYRGEEDDD